MNPTLALDIARPWRTHPRETLGLGMLGLVSAIALAGAASPMNWIPGSQPAEAEAPLPALPDVTAVRPVAPDAAVAINSQIPFAGGPNPAALPFAMGASAGETRERALECLTSAIYYEAGQEPLAGQQAVAQVVLNRVRHPAFPASVCGVVYQGSTRQTGCQFTFTCDGSMAYAPVRSLWNRAYKVAEAALNGYVFAPVGYATHYHANYVVPYWASSLTKTNVQGAHIFYRWPGGWGRPAAFTDRWTAKEGSPAALRMAALNAPRPAAPLGEATVVASVEKLREAGAKVIEGKDGRVRLLFTPEAREAVEKVKVTPYVERVAASDNLRRALDGASPPDDRPFGRKPEGVGSAAEQALPASPRPAPTSSTAQ